MSTDGRAVLRVVSGNPSDEELAALTAVVSAASAPDETASTPLRGRWNDPAATHRRTVRPGPGAWQAALR